MLPQTQFRPFRSRCWQPVTPLTQLNCTCRKTLHNSVQLDKPKRLNVGLQRTQQANPDSVAPWLRPGSIHRQQNRHCEWVSGVYLCPTRRSLCVDNRSLDKDEAKQHRKTLHDSEKVTDRTSQTQQLATVATSLLLGMPIARAASNAGDAYEDDDDDGVDNSSKLAPKHARRCRRPTASTLGDGSAAVLMLGLTNAARLWHCGHRSSTHRVTVTAESGETRRDDTVSCEFLSIRWKCDFVLFPAAAARAWNSLPPPSPSCFVNRIVPAGT